MAGIFAAWEFRRSQLRPSLQLLLHDRKRDKMGASLVTTKDRNKSVPFDIYIRNTGPAVARFVRINILFAGEPLFFRPPSITTYRHRWPLLGPRPLKEYWQPQDLAMGTAFIFDGKDEYVCHPGAEDMLGSFQLSIEAGY